MKFLNRLFISLVLTFVQIAYAMEESTCGKNVHVLKIFGQERDSFGKIRDGVIAQDDEGLKWMALVLSASTNRENISFAEQLRLASAMFFCNTHMGPKSGNILYFKTQDCLNVEDVVGLRLKSHTETPDSVILISSIDINGETDEGLLPPPIELSGEKDICFKRAEEVYMVTVYGKSMNTKDSRASLALELLVKEPSTTMHVKLEHFGIEL